MMTNGTTSLLDDVGRLVLRVTIGGLMLFHGIHKIFHGVEGIAGMLERQGFPQFLAYGVFVGEVVAPILMIVGFFARPAAAVLAFTMVVAIYLAHSQDLLKLGEQGQWAVELPILFLFGSIAIALYGAGRFSVSKGRGLLH